MFDLIVVPVIVRGSSLTPEDKELLFKLFVFLTAGSGWLMFFQFVFGRIFHFIKFINSKINKDRNDKK